MKKFAWYNPNTLEARLINSKRMVNTLIGSSAPIDAEIDGRDESNPGSDTNKNLYLIELNYERNDDGHYALSETTYANPEMEHLNIGGNMPKSDLRHEKLGRTIKELGKSSVLVLRAMDAVSDTLKPMDYVLTNKTLLSKNDVKSVESFFNGDIDDVSPSAKALKWVAEHAISMAVSYGRPQHVVKALVMGAKVSEATNADEFIYTGNVKKGQIIMSFDENGNIMKTPEKTLEMTP